jgi:imidazolonepropionase-like amidohydrolase
MGREHDIGTLEPGKVADFIVLESNPLDDIANLRTIVSVARAGELMPIAELAFDPAR